MKDIDNVNEQQSLLAAFILNKKGVGKEVDWPEIEAWNAKQGLLWIHLDRTNKEAQEWLKTKAGIDPLVVTKLIEDDTRPCSTKFEDGVLIDLRGVNLNPGQDPEDMVSIRIWVEKNRIITTRRRPLAAIRDLEEAVRSKHDGPLLQSDFVYWIANRLVDRMAPTLNFIEEHLDSIDESIPNDIDEHTNSELSKLRRQCIYLRRFLSPQIEALDNLVVHHPKWFSEESIEYIKEARNRTQRYVENLDAMRDRATVCQEELFMTAAEKSAQTTTILTVVAAIFLPLSFLTGLLGINVGGIPSADNPMGFLIVTGILFVILVIELIIFKLLKWY